MTEATVVSRVLRQLLWTLCIYFFLRLLFLGWNFQLWYAHIPPDSWLAALLEGIRFDISIVFTLSGLILIASLLPWPAVPLRLKSMTLTSALLLLHTPLLIPNIADSEFIHFIGRRFTADSFFLAREIPGKTLSLISSYWPLAILGLGVLIFYIKGMLLIGQTESKNFFANKKKRLVVSLGIVVLIVIGGRGGLQLKPLELTHAMSWNDARLSHLVLNSSFTLAHALNMPQLKPISYFSNEEELLSQLNQNLPGDVALFPARPKNVVLIILESFSLEYLGYPHNGDGFTPFIDELASQSLVFNHAFANGRRSIEALPSLLAGLPSLSPEPFLTGRYQDIKIPQLAQSLNNKNIFTAFFHGGQNGTMFFDQFAQRIGFEKYYGAKEYPHAKDHDGTWGIWDEPYMQYMADELDKQTKPFFVTFFSLSSHHPFQVPENYQGQFKAGDLPIHQTVGYTDMALKKFFERIKNSPWYEETLFIITADHTSKSSRPGYQNFLGSYKIPLLMYWPANLWPENIPLNQPVQQADIAETIKDVFELPDSTFKFSRSLFRSGERTVILAESNQEVLIRWPYVFSSSDNGDTLFNLETDPELKSPLDTLTAPIDVNALRQQLRAHRQYFNNSLIRNRM